MEFISDKRLALAWSALVSITLASWFIAASHGAGPIQPDPAVGMIAIGITLAKVRVIAHEFMELRHAPHRLRLVIDSWLVSFGMAMTFAYFY